MTNETPSTSGQPVKDVPWIVKGEDLRENVMRLRDKLARDINIVVPLAVRSNTDSSIRHEYRKMISASNIIKESSNLQLKMEKYMENTVKLAEKNKLTLERLVKKLQGQIDELRHNMVVLNANISPETQRAVLSIIDMRYEELSTMEFEELDDIEDCYKNYRKISQLCDFALNSIDQVYKANRDTKRIIKQQKQYKNELATRSTSPKSSLKAKVETKLSGLSIEKLQALANFLKN